MPPIHFFGKDNCINNLKQKDVLRLSGFDVIEHDILSQSWTQDSLRPFFDGMPVAEWFNPSAPSIKSGDVDPHSFSEDEALAAMVGDPYLIRRPLMILGGHYLCGFDEGVLSRIKLRETNSAPGDVENLLKQDLTQCPKSNTNQNCDSN